MTERTDLPQTPLYHYTDSAGLLGILAYPEKFKGAPKGMTFGTLWATDANYLNDSEEVTYGSEILAEELEKQADAPEQTPSVATKLRELADDVHENRFDMTWHEQAQQAVPYVACLCEDGDLLSQWRGYGDGGGGYAIVFTPATLTRFYTVNADMVAYGDEFGLAAMQLQDGPERIIYGHNDTRARMAEYAQEKVKSMKLVEAKVRDYSWDIYRLTALTALTQVKHDAFLEEAEWRFIEHDAGMGKAEFRAGNIGLIPYTKLYFPITDGTHGDPTITEIVVGPGGDRTLRANALRDCSAK
ncbi:hypothetical protein B2J88_44255 [Rhodococcus sp. SRB_17]|nr:hypothetical protein [Rhodococcus sp. SRB_17]